MPRLYAELKSPHEGTRQKMVERLRELDRPPAELIEALRPLLQDPSEEVREELAEAFGEIAAEPAFELLIAMLGDVSSEVREEALEALQRHQVPVERYAAHLSRNSAPGP